MHAVQIIAHPSNTPMTTERMFDVESDEIKMYESLSLQIENTFASLIMAIIAPLVIIKLFSKFEMLSHTHW